MTDRRQFIQSLSAILAGLFSSTRTHAAIISGNSDRLGTIMPTRKLGNTGESVTMLGVGGYHFGSVSESDSQAILEAALEGGVRFFDNAKEYQGGGAESRMGKLLTPKYRDVVFIMTKSTATTAADAQKELDDSLLRLDTDYLDLWQIHSLTSEQDVEDRIKNGVLDVFLKAKEEKKIRHIGFTGHTTYKSHVHILEKTKDIKPFATAQMPINVLDPSYESFILNVVPKLVENNIGVLAMKTLAFGRFLSFGDEGKKVIPDRISLQDALHFVWSLPVTCLITGATSVAEIKEKIALANSFSGMKEEERNQLIAKAADLAGKEREWYKA